MSTRTAPSVLVIEPDETLRDAMRAALGAEGFAVYAAADAETGFSVLLSLRSCACIILGAQQAGLSAIDFVDRKHSYVRFHRIPLVTVGDTPHGLGFGTHVTLAPVRDVRQITNDIVHVVRRAVPSTLARDAKRDAE